MAGSKIYVTLQVDDKGTAVVKKFGMTTDKAFDRLKKHVSAGTHQAGKMEKAWSGAVNKLKRHWKSYAVGATAAIAAVGAAIYAGIRVVKDLTAAYAKQERAEHTLAAALRASGEYTQRRMQGLKTYAASIQRVTKYGDEEVLQLMALEKSLGVTGPRLEEAARMTVGLAAATGRNVNSMAQYVAMAMQGDFTMLRRYIPALRQTTDKTKQLQIVMDFAARGFRVAEADAKTYSGTLKQMGNAFGDVKEKLGRFVAEGMKPLLWVLTALFSGWSDNLQQMTASKKIINSVQNNILRFASATIDAFAGIVDAVEIVRTAWNIMQNVFNRVGKAIVFAAQKMLGAFIAVGKYIPFMGDKVKNLQRAYDLLGATMQGMDDDYRQNIRDMANAGKQGAALHRVADALKKKIADQAKVIKEQQNPALLDFIRRSTTASEKTATFSKNITKAKKTVKNFASEVIKEAKSISEATASQFDNISEGWNIALTSMRDKNEDIWSRITDETAISMSGIKKEHKDVYDSIKVDLAGAFNANKAYFDTLDPLAETSALMQIKYQGKIKAAHKKSLEETHEHDLAYWVGVVNNANTTEKQLREAWQHINAIAKQNNISAVQAFKLGWKDATHQFKTDSMIWLEVGRNTAQTLQKDFSDYFFNAFEGHLKSLKDFWKGIWNDMKAIFLRAIADMLANSLVKTFFGMFGKGFSLNIGGGGALSTVAGGASIAGLIKKIPGVVPLLSKIPGVAGLLGLGGGLPAAFYAPEVGYMAAPGATAVAGGTTAAGATAAGLSTASALGLGAILPLGMAAIGFGMTHRKSWNEKLSGYEGYYSGLDLGGTLKEMTSGFGHAWSIAGAERLAQLYPALTKAAAEFAAVQNDQKINYEADMNAARQFSNALGGQIELLRGATGAGAALRDRLTELKGRVDATATAAGQDLANGLKEAINNFSAVESWSHRAWTAFAKVGSAGQTSAEQIQLMKDKLKELNAVDPKIDISLKGHIDRIANKILGGQAAGIISSQISSTLSGASGGRVGTYSSTFDISHHTGYNVPSWIPKHHDGYYPSTGEHLAIIRNDETVLTPKQVSSVERAVNAPINLAIKIVTESGKVLMDKVVSELKTRSSNGEIVLYTEGLTTAEG